MTGDAGGWRHPNLRGDAIAWLALLCLLEAAPASEARIELEISSAVAMWFFGHVGLSRSMAVAERTLTPPLRPLSGASSVGEAVVLTAKRQPSRALRPGSAEHQRWPLPTISSYGDRVGQLHISFVSRRGACAGPVIA